MRAIVQRVKRARVTVGDEEVGKIGKGLVVLLGVGKDDSEIEAQWVADKVSNLRIFEDDAGKMNLGVKDIGGEILAVSQFTLYGDVRKGNRPSFTDAAPPELADRLYKFFKAALERNGLKVSTGRFAAKMDVTLINWGPVTIILDNEKPEQNIATD